METRLRAAVTVHCSDVCCILVKHGETTLPTRLRSAIIDVDDDDDDDDDVVVVVAAAAVSRVMWFGPKIKVILLMRYED